MIFDSRMLVVLDMKRYTWIENVMRQDADENAQHQQQQHGMIRCLLHRGPLPEGPNQHRVETEHPWSLIGQCPDRLLSLVLHAKPSVSGPLRPIQYSNCIHPWVTAGPASQKRAPRIPDNVCPMSVFIAGDSLQAILARGAYKRSLKHTHVHSWLDVWPIPLDSMDSDPGLTGTNGEVFVSCPMRDDMV